MRDVACGRTRRGVLISLALLAALVPAASASARSSDVIPGRYVVVFKSTVGSVNRETDQRERTDGFKARFRYGHAIKGFAASLSPAQVAKLRADPEVAAVSADREVFASAAVPLAGGETVPTGVQRMGAASGPGAGATVRQASSVNVAVIDTGIDLTHPDLNAASGTNCVSPGSPANDDNGHGSHVAGTIGARNDGSTAGESVVGVAPGTKLFAAKVLNSAGSGSWSQVICGIDWATGTRTDTDPTNDISVANMSLGGSGTSTDNGACGSTTALHQAICNSVATGVTYVVAAGNSGWAFPDASLPDVPAAYPEVLTVTAVSDGNGQPGGGSNPSCRRGEVDDQYASFSNFAGSSPADQSHTIAAPGVCIRSTWMNHGYNTISGTSMATPHITGAVALCLGEGAASGPCTGLTPAQIVQKLRQDAADHTTASPGFGFTGDPLHSVARGYFGFLDWAGIAAIDTTAPTVSSKNPPAGATNVAVTAAVSVTFSEPMDQIATQSAFSLTAAGSATPETGSYSWSGNTITFAPATPLAKGVQYTARVKGGAGGAADRAGNTLAIDEAWSFTTSAVTAFTAFPATTTIQAGGVRAGSATSLRLSDNVYYDVNSTTSGTRTSDWYGRFTGVSSALGNLKVTYEGRSSRTTTQTVSVFNWTTGLWVQLDSRSVSNGDVTINLVPAGTLADYVSATGELRIRVRNTNGSRSFYSRGDLMKIAYDAP